MKETSALAPLNYGVLLRRQQQLQTAGNLPLPTRPQVTTALVTEIGELSQELKAAWCWWPNKATAPVRERVLEEAADVLHFLLLLDLVADPENVGCADWGDIALHGSYAFYKDAQLIHELLDEVFNPESDGNESDFPGWTATEPLLALLAPYEISAQDLADAYWRKGDENLRRWGVGA